MRCLHCDTQSPDQALHCSKCGTLLQPPSGERRQLTVMFCDVVGSTALSLEMDPEELAELIRAYQVRCGEIVRQENGYVAQYLGDGILAYFGYPEAREDDSRRAVRAGLEIV